MKSATLLAKRLLPLLILMLGFSIKGSAQAWNLPHCSGNSAGKIYYLPQLSPEIQIMDPANPMGARASGIFVPGGARALAIGLLPPGQTGPNPTYYTVAPTGTASELMFWNGTVWVTTRVVMNGVNNLAGSCGFIYGYDCTGGFLYQWEVSDTTPSLRKPVNPSFGTTGVCDISGDCKGGYWLLSDNTATNPTLRHYNWPPATPSPILDSTFTITGTYPAANEGLAVIGNNVYYDGADNRLYTGVRSRTPNTVGFTASASQPFLLANVFDFASCGQEGACAGRGARDTLYACTSNTDAIVTLRATGPGPYNWAVNPGSGATFTTAGNAATIRTANTTTVTYRSADCSNANTIVDTTVIVINNAVIDAGPNDTIIGCQGIYIDTLRGSIRDTTRGLFYAYDWSPLNGVIQGNTTLDSAIISLTACTKFFLTVTTNTGCRWVDSLIVCVADSTPRPNFIVDRRFGCDEDTVRFINTTPTNPYTSYVKWNFGDTTESFDISPTHIYEDQGIYTVTLTMANQYCMDSIKINVNILHPLDAQFNVADTAVCANSIIQFNDASTFSRGPNNIDPIYLYDFGDGTTSTQSRPVHTYPIPGRYLVRMRIQDYLGCVDSVQRYIVVDTLPIVTLRTADTLICEGQAVTLIGDFSRVGNTGTIFNMGDGTIYTDEDTVRYSYQTPGNYTITFRARYRICPEATITRQVTVNPFPGVYIGEDTVLCPNGAPIVLSERKNIGVSGARYLWSTGDTTASINARDIGTYWARVTTNGCSGTDSLTVNKDCYVDIPNTFSPNGDGVNDYFLPRQFLSRSVTSFKMSIFNRWGQTIFETTALDGRGWDGRFNGKEQPTGVFVYLIDVAFDNGVREHYTGNVTLIR